MWSVKDMFYGEAEPVWILKPEKEGNKMGSESKGQGSSGGGGSRKQVERAEDYSILSSIPYYPYYYPDYIPPPQPKRQVESSRTGNASSDPYRQQSNYYPDYIPPPQPKRQVESSRTGNAASDPYRQQSSSDPYRQQSSQPGSNDPYRQQSSQHSSQQRGQQGGQQGGQQKDSRIVMKIPICCGECVESIEATLYRMRGVKSVQCDILREKVTVVTTTAAPADILMECRKVFRKSRFWTDDD